MNRTSGQFEIHDDHLFWSIDPRCCRAEANASRSRNALISRLRSR
ncbi:hypothetical protein [Planctomicrobium piriforme]|nr:hypothetical protein [Planctomicrobium piriforme]